MYKSFTVIVTSPTGPTQVCVEAEYWSIKDGNTLTFLDSTYSPSIAFAPGYWLHVFPTPSVTQDSDL